jgi:hypothetical protein
MLPYQRNKIDISVRQHQLVTFVDAEVLSRLETEHAGAGALEEIWKVAYTQERVDEDAESGMFGSLLMLLTCGDTT